MTPFIIPPTILIVDDTPSNLSVVVNLFEEHGFRVAIAQDGTEGLQRAQLVQPDLILLDVMMPDIDGFEVCRQLKALESTRNIPVIFMTALATSEHKVKGFQAGGVDYVTKPLQIDEVMARVETHLKLSAAQKTLAKHNEELELRVAERTAALEAREREFRTLVENAPDVIARYDRQCRFIYTNPQHDKTIGVSQREILGKTLTELFSDVQDAADYQALMMKVIETGQAEEMLLTLPDDGNGLRYHYIRLVAELDAKDQVIGVLAIGRDITAMKRAERELHLRNRALDSSFDATYLVDTDLHIRYVNEAAVRELGYSREELLTMSLFDIAPNVTREMVQGLMAQTASAGRFPGTVESRHRRKSGELFPIEVGATTFNYEGESLFLTVVRNITERKHAESALRESEQRYREIFENVTDSLYLIEVTPEGRFRNLAFNTAFEKSTGIPRAVLIGHDSGGVKEGLPEGERVTEETARSVLAKYRHCVESGVAIEENSVLDLPSGVRHYHSTLVPLRDESGRIHRILGVAHDVTEIKKAERELEESRTQLRGLAAQRETAREEERKYIAREVHDELGQILTGLQLNISVLKHKYSADSEPMREHLKDTMALTDRALGVARNVASALRPAALDMGIMSALEWLSARFASNTGIDCTVEVEVNDAQFDEASAIAMFRIVQESLTNISRHAKAKQVVISMVRSGDDYVLKVRDNGCGFDSVGKKENSFGLVGIRERVLMLGGQLSINSRLGAGTEIEVQIPANYITLEEA